MPAIKSLRRLVLQYLQHITNKPTFTHKNTFNMISTNLLTLFAIIYNEYYLLLVDRSRIPVEATMPLLFHLNGNYNQQQKNMKHFHS
jgi:hypothetical protein